MNTIRSPPQPAPLSASNTYTTWPGGVDPTARLFNTDNQKGGLRKRSRKSKRATRKSRKSRKAKKASRRSSRR